MARSGPAPGWFRYKLARPLAEGEVEDLKSLAGPLYRGAENAVAVHENCAWLFERWAARNEITNTCTLKPKPVVPFKDFPVVPGLREWVPGFLTEYQRNFVLNFVMRDGVFCILGTGAGKTVLGIIYAMCHEGTCVFITRAAARRTIASEIRRFTIHEPAVLEAGGTEIPEGTKFIVVGWESLQNHLRAILRANPKILVADESHLAKSWKRYEAVIQRNETQGDTVREGGEEKITFRKLNNRFAAAETLSRTCEWHLALTATPIRDRIRDLWAQLDLIMPRAWGGFYKWAARYCVPGYAPIWMGDFTFKPISEVKVGDEVIGWSNERSEANERRKPNAQYRRWKLVRAKVEQVHFHPQAPLIRVTMESGRVIDCTPDHRWLRGEDFSSVGGEYAYIPARVGRRLCFVADPSPVELSDEEKHLAGWLGGMYDGEGSGPIITQSQAHNPKVFAALDSALTRLGIPHTMVGDRPSGAGCATITGGRDGLLRFHKIARPVRFADSAARFVLTGTIRRNRDRIVKIEEIDPGPVYTLTTSTGNYVAYGYASKNCDAKESPWGGIDTRGTSRPELVSELLSRISFSTYYVPQSVTHRNLPPKRRQVTYIKADELTTGRDVMKEMREHAYRSATGEVWARLALAAAMKRKRVVEEAVEGAYRAPDGRAGGKVVIFTGLRTDADKIAAELKKAHHWTKSGVSSKALPTIFVGHGGMDPRLRDRVREEYMAHPGPCVLVGTTDSWGESLNLQDTDLSIMAMLPFTPGQVRQAEGRFVRQGMTRPCLILYLVAEGTADEHVAMALLSKLPAVEAVARDEVLAEFGRDLKGDEDEIAAGMLAKMLAEVEDEEDGS